MPSGSATGTATYPSNRAEVDVAAYWQPQDDAARVWEPKRWQDIWLNEGWATNAQWLWTDHTGGTTAQQNYDEVLTIPADDKFWDLAIADPGPLGLFAHPVYDRGAATLHALRQVVGDAAFFAGAKLWLTRYNDSNGTTEDFQAVYEEVSGKDLQGFFDVWVRTPTKPTAW